MGPLMLLATWLGNPPGSCPAECPQWVYHYFRDCVCDMRDAISLFLGLASVFFWATAEIPQIVTNFCVGSTEGISLTFLLTWTVGDVFNLAGCLLEPATLPTQLYMAVMYTLTTLVLVFQSIYYEWIRPQVPKVHELPVDSSVAEPLLNGQEQEAAAAAAKALLQGVPEPSSSSVVPVPPAASEVISVPALSRKASSQYIHSARSLASSHTPTMGSFMPGSLHQHHVGSLLSQSPGVGFSHVSLRQGQGSLSSRNATPHHASLPRHAPAHPILSQPGQPIPGQPSGGAILGQSSVSPSPGTFPGESSGGEGNSSSSFTSARAVLSLGMLLMVLGSASSHLNMDSSSSASTSSSSPWHLPSILAILNSAALAGVSTQPIPVSWSKGARRVLLSLPAQGVPQGHHKTHGLPQPSPGLGWSAAFGSSRGHTILREGIGGRVGELLGWLMAAIYMGGRLPQIWLNIQRGTVEGLSPIMFLFALLGNVTYVGSILVRSMAWEDIGPNLPWIVDAGVCVLLDLFILGQFVYYSIKNSGKEEEEYQEESVYPYK